MSYYVPKECVMEHLMNEQFRATGIKSRHYYKLLELLCIAMRNVPKCNMLHISEPFAKEIAVFESLR